MKTCIALTIALLFSATSVSAGKAEADACAAGLDGDSRKIYNRVAPNVDSNKEANETMFRTVVKKMIDDGEVKFFGVKSRAKAAATCVKLINQ